MSDPKRGDDTKADRPAALPSITAPKFGRTGHPAPEVSVTSPATTPEVAVEPEQQEEERTRTETQLDPSAYAPPADKDPDELSSEFQPVSGKELDARGRLVKQAPSEPAPAPAPLPPEDVPPTEVAVPQAPPAPPARSSKKAAARQAAPEPGPPVQQVAAKRREPGRWILDKEGHVAKESDDSVEPSAFDPTVRKAVPSGPLLRRIPRAAMGAAAAVLVLLAGAGVWALRSSRQDENAGAEGQVVDAGVQAVPRIRVTSRPSGATVKINGLPFGTTPVDRESPFAPEAELEVEVLLKGHRPWTRRFHAGESVTAHAPLKQAK
jgi:PEGA domain-containing protein